MKKFLTVLVVMVMIPYVTTLAWTGRLDSEAIWEDWGARDGAGSGRTVIVERGGREIPVDAEDFLVGVLASQIPADYGTETVKAQAVLARTYIYRELSGADTIREESLDMDCMSRAQMEELWGEAMFPVYYKKFQDAIAATGKEALWYEGELAEPFFCRAASGRTRDGSEKTPYLVPVDSPGDLEADGFLSLTEWKAGEIARRVSAIPEAAVVTAQQIPSEIQIVARDGSGYVEEIQIGGKVYTGEEIQYALGLPSSCYTFEALEDSVRISCKGVGHGYGFSQAGANALERGGHDYKELLAYYFPGAQPAGAGDA